MTKEQFFQKAFEKFSGNQIDAMFLYIQNDKELMKNYLDTVAEAGSLGDVNRYIARRIAQTEGTRARQHGNKPNSTLIQSNSILED